MAKAKWAKPSQARRELLPAFKTSWPYTFLGLAVGLLCIFIAERSLTEKSTSRLIVEHLGMGFIVAAIAVFFYEWGAHIRKALDLSQDLVDTIRDDIKPIVLNLSEGSLPKLLRNLLQENSSVGQRYTREMVADIDKLVKATASLQKDGIWVKEHYIGVLAESLQVIRKNAETLRDLEHGYEHRFIAPTSEDSIDKILVAQMRSLKDRDTYDVITNLYSWRPGRLDELRKETGEAITSRGVIVRRIFNLLFPVPLTREDIKLILTSHLPEDQNRESGKNLEAKILGPTELGLISSAELKYYVGGLHFGIFSHGVHSLKIQLSRSRDLSEVQMTMNDRELESARRLFEEAWRVARPMSREAIEDCIRFFPVTAPEMEPPEGSAPDPLETTSRAGSADS